MTYQTIDRPATARRGLLLAMSLGYFMVLLDSTILNIALPAIATSLGGSVAGQQWTISAYLVTFGAVLLSGGALADRFGARRSFLVGMAAFGATSMLCAVAPDLLVLVIFRALQGIAAALIPSSSLALIGALHPGPADRHRAVGLWALITGVGFAAGPLLGGLLLQVASWHWIFAVNVPVAAAAVWWCRRLPVSEPRTPTARLDLVTQSVAVVFFGLLVNAVIELGRPGPALLWSAPALLVAGAMLWCTERRSGAPAIPVALLAVSEVRLAAVLGFGIQVVMAGALFVLSLYLIDVRGLAPMVGGLAMLPYTVGPLMGPVAGRAVVRFGPALPLVLGLGLTAAGFAVAGIAVGTGGSLVPLLIGLLVAGPGLPLTLVPLTTLIVGGAPAGSQGVSGGLFNAARQLGGAVGVAALGAVVTGLGVRHGAAVSLLVLAAVATAMTAVRLARIRPGGR